MTQTDYNNAYNNALNSLTAFRLREVTGRRFGMTTRAAARSSKLLWLYLNALNRYNPTASNNFLSEDQVRFIFEQITILSGTINGPIYS